MAHGPVATGAGVASQHFDLLVVFIFSRPRSVRSLQGNNVADKGPVFMDSKVPLPLLSEPSAAQGGSDAG
jgi:hypothetical protein